MIIVIIRYYNFYMWFYAHRRANVFAKYDTFELTVAVQ